MAYAQKYKITPGLKGFWVWEVNDKGSWDQLGLVFNTKEEAEVAIKRICSGTAWFYDESGEAV